MSKCPVPAIACYLLRSKLVDTSRASLCIGNSSRAHRQATMINIGKTAGLNFCGRRNEKQMKAMAAKNVNQKYHRRKTGRLLLNSSQRPAGKCKGMSQKRL